MLSTLKVALVQVAAGRDRARNLARVRELLEGVPPVDLIALPEVFSLRGSDDDYRAGSEAIPGPTTAWLSDLARRRNAWVLGGSLIERARGRLFNTSALVSRSGRIAATYRKIHLFEARLENGMVIRERDVYGPGREPRMVRVNRWPSGMAVCYDLRFPELFRHYVGRGARLLLVPSNFTQRTGKDHWEILVRARAIENQCFVLAPNQCGANAVTGVASHGHSLIVGPWGEVLGQAGKRDEVLVAELDPAVLETTRRRIPALRHRQPGLF